MNDRPQNWKPRRERGDSARQVAFEALRAVEEDESYANLVLPELIRRAHLNKLDAAYATNLCYGTLRMRARWDAIIARSTQGRDLSQIDPPLLDLLRIGCHQLLDMETPAHAAIYETVAIVRNVCGQGAAGFANAVLRRVSERKNKWRDILSASTASYEEFLAVWYSHPRWIVEELAKSLEKNGRSKADLVHVLQANNTPAKVSLVARDITAHQLCDRIADAGLHAVPGHLMDSAVELEGGDPHRLWAVQDKLAGVQDEGSQLISAVVTQTPLTGTDKLWLDLCAGPGGKTATMAVQAALRGAHIHANELHEHRLRLVADSVQPWKDIVALRLGSGVEIGDEEPNTYDRVLVDVPCTGAGALRRRPEARWRKHSDHLAKLNRLQLALLESGFAALRPGGVIIYATCSPLLAETWGIIETFMAGRTDAVMMDAGDIASRVALQPVASHDQLVQMWPDIYGTDAMFFAVLMKREAE